MTSSTEFLNVAEVAETMGTTAMNVMMHIKKKIITGEEINGGWFVAKDSLTNYLNKLDRKPPSSLCKSSCKHGCSGCG